MQYMVIVLWCNWLSSTAMKYYSAVTNYNCQTTVITGRFLETINKNEIHYTLLKQMMDVKSHLRSLWWMWKVTLSLDQRKSNLVGKSGFVRT